MVGPGWRTRSHHLHISTARRPTLHRRAGGGRYPGGAATPINMRKGKRRTPTPSVILGPFPVIPDSDRGSAITPSSNPPPRQNAEAATVFMTALRKLEVQFELGADRVQPFDYLGMVRDALFSPLQLLFVLRQTGVVNPFVARRGRSFSQAAQERVHVLFEYVGIR